MIDAVIETVVDIERYPITDLQAPLTVEVIQDARQSLRDRGVASLPGFLPQRVVDEVAADALDSKTRAHLQDAMGTPYLGPPDTSFAEDHPRRHVQHSKTWILAYDLVTANNPLIGLFESDAMTSFVAALVAEIVDHRPLHRMADPLGALNITIMDDSHVQGWHFDSTDFVVSLAIQSSDAGGAFECARDIRDAERENYEAVATVLDGSAVDLVETYSMTAGSLMVFMGRNSLHRVAPVAGSTPRVVGLFGYDTRTDTNSSETLKRVRYGRTEAIPR